jgi:hypothetical protein
MSEPVRIEMATPLVVRVERSGEGESKHVKMELSCNAKGQYSWTVTAYGDDVEDALNQVVNADKSLKTLYGASQS